MINFILLQFLPFSDEEKKEPTPMAHDVEKPMNKE